ncbi:TPA: DUF3164 family protein [Burkholderia stabilis]|nr:DUF3164 family protein [Burkholderia stabilis]HDR9589133.1 DUF3164 family protein [Burkholderia stabilis]HDR9649529.1 DUF3164 family protein [Burkholderia stabilis]HDR9653595.1 DUF3164 family protein [Burkholderia stabilis]HDR9656290.1 DUF3164 family protein [Burkholderia stabilis]
MTELKDGDYRTDAQGRLVPIDLIRPIDLARDDFVMEALGKATRVKEQMTRLSAELLGDIDAFIELSAERYGAKIGGQKGNVTLTSYDGNTRILRVVPTSLTFDEGIQAAKALVDECVREWSAGTRSEIRVLIADAFQTDRIGKISTERVLRLRTLEITDERWLRAMAAISDSVRIQYAAAYVRIERRNEKTGKFEAIRFDLAAI